jgi:hypothetical protein
MPVTLLNEVPVRHERPTVGASETLWYTTVARSER